MSFYNWLQSQSLDFWIVFALGVIPIIIAAYEFYKGEDRAAAILSLLGTAVILAAIVVVYFHRTWPDGRRPPIQIPAIPAACSDNDVPWQNAWPNLSRDPDGVSSVNGNPADRSKALTLWVEGVSYTPEHTILHVAVNNWTENLPATLQQGGGSYLVDGRGQGHDLQQECWHGEGAFLANGSVRGTATERLELIFPRIQAASFIVLHHPQFKPITIYQYKLPPPTITFCRPRQVIGAGNELEMYCDGAHLVGVAMGKSATTTLAPGKHSCMAKYKSFPYLVGDAVEFNAQVGKDYYFKPHLAFLTAEPNLVLCPADQCLKPE